LKSKHGTRKQVSLRIDGHILDWADSMIPHLGKNRSQAIRNLTRIAYEVAGHLKKEDIETLVTKKIHNKQGVSTLILHLQLDLMESKIDSTQKIAELLEKNTHSATKRINEIYKKLREESRRTQTDA